MICPWDKIPVASMEEKTVGWLVEFAAHTSCELLYN